jgi:hypothetical protein
MSRLLLDVCAAVAMLASPLPRFGWAPRRPFDGVDEVDIDAVENLPATPALRRSAVEGYEMFRRFCAELLDRADYLLTRARLRLLDWATGPAPETPTDRAIREQGERLRSVFPQVDFDDPSRHVR